MHFAAMCLALAANTSVPLEQVDFEFHQESGSSLKLADGDADVIFEPDCDGCLLGAEGRIWLDSEGAAHESIYVRADRSPGRGEIAVASPQQPIGTRIAIEMILLIEREKGKITELRRVGFYIVERDHLRATTWVDFACSSTSVKCVAGPDGLVEVHLEHD